MKKVWAIVLSVAGAIVVVGIAVFAILRGKDYKIELAWYAKKKAEEKLAKQGIKAEEELQSGWKDVQEKAAAERDSGGVNINDTIDALRGRSPEA